MAISVSDAVALQSGTNDPYTTASFDPGAADALLVACCMFNSAAGATPTLTMSNPAGSAITWTSRGKRGASEGRSGVCEIFTAPVTGGSGSRTVRCATNAAASDDAGGLKMFVVTGHDTASPVGAAGEGSDTTNEITPTVLTSTVDGSEVFVAASEWNSLGAPTSTDLPSPPTRGESFDNNDIAGIALRKTAATSGTNVTVNLNAGGTSAAEWNWVAVEIKPAAAGTDLVVADAAHGHTADAPALTQVHALAAQDAAHAHTADGPVLTQVHHLAVADAAHTHSADNVVLSLGAIDLAVADAAHSHAAESPALTQAHSVAVADAAHGHTADAPVLTQVHVLAVQDASHSHTAESPTLNLAANLAVQDAGHTHTADSPTLTQVHLLAVDGAVHAHLAESLALTQLHLLAVDNALHGHTAGAVVLTNPDDEPEPTGARTTSANPVGRHQTGSAGRYATSSARGRL